MSAPVRFRSDELGPTEPHDRNHAMDAVRALEDAAADVQVRTGSLFADRVMAAIADQPSPAPGGFLVPLRRSGILGGFVQSVRQAWASIGGGRPALARAMALAYVLLVATAGISLAGAATFGAAGAFGLLTPQHTVAPSTDATEAPQATEAEAVEPDKSSAEPSDAPEASPDESEGPDEHGGGTEPEASDDHGDNSGPDGGGDDRSGPSTTDEPDASDDHSGSDDGGSGSDDGTDSGGTGSGADD